MMENNHSSNLNNDDQQATTDLTPSAQNQINDMDERAKLEMLNRPSWYKPFKGPLYFAAIMVVVVLVYMTFFRPTGEPVTGDLPAAMKEAQQRKLPMVITFTDPPTCPPCARMEKTTWPDQRVQEYIKENYVVVKLNPYDDKNRSYVDQYKVEGIPVTIIATSEGKALRAEEGYMKPEALINFMKQTRDHAVEADPLLSAD